MASLRNHRSVNPLSSAETIVAAAATTVAITPRAGKSSALFLKRLPFGPGQGLATMGRHPNNNNNNNNNGVFKNHSASSRSSSTTPHTPSSSSSASSSLPSKGKFPGGPPTASLGSRSSSCHSRSSFANSMPSDTALPDLSQKDEDRDVDEEVLYDDGHTKAGGPYRAEDDYASTGSTTRARLSVMEWLETICPQDVVPKILAFSGPQQAAAMTRVNRHWRSVMQLESTWRILSEELYKWRPGEPEPESWKDYYRMNPCVPVDYSSIDRALKTVSVWVPSRPPARRRTAAAPPGQWQQVKSLRIFLRPGKYYLDRAITIQAVQGVRITMETMTMPDNLFRSLPTLPPEQAPAASEPSPVPSSRRRKTLRDLMRCHRANAVEETEHSETLSSDPDHYHQLAGGAALGGQPGMEDWPEFYMTSAALSRLSPKCATLELRSRAKDEPAICVRQGAIYLNHLQIHHNSHGHDIWNGNAAIQVQPPLDDEHRPVAVEPRPSAHLERVVVSSRSGRGIVNIEGGLLIVRRCAVHDCAATGIYVGGPGSQAHVERTDVVRNGVGNRFRRGIARGHSGIYLEQGLARIIECNISHNTLTGLSAVSPDNAIVHLERSDLVGNGTHQLELPDLPSEARRRSVLEHNYTSVAGTPASRSGLMPASSLSEALMG